MGLKTFWRSAKKGYVRFVEKQGFGIIITVCVAVITATAVWTKQSEPAYVAPTPPPGSEISAAQLMQQSLRSAATPTPAPTAAASKWIAPLSSLQVAGRFNTSRMVQGSVTGVWTLHDAADLAADAGTPVLSMADGVVTAVGNDRLQGAWIAIDHGDGYEAHYAGLAMITAFLPGDTVVQGETVGYAGEGPLDEGHLGPHVHLRVTLDGTAVDPVGLFADAE